MPDANKRIVLNALAPVTGSLMNVENHQQEANSKVNHVKMLTQWIVIQEQDVAVK